MTIERYTFLFSFRQIGYTIVQANYRRISGWAWRSAR